MDQNVTGIKNWCHIFQHVLSLGLFQAVYTSVWRCWVCYMLRLQSIAGQTDHPSRASVSSTEEGIRLTPDQAHPRSPALVMLSVSLLLAWIIIQTVVSSLCIDLSHNLNLQNMIALFVIYLCYCISPSYFFPHKPSVDTLANDLLWA